MDDFEKVSCEVQKAMAEFAACEVECAALGMAVNAAWDADKALEAMRNRDRLKLALREKQRDAWMRARSAMSRLPGCNGPMTFRKYQIEAARTAVYPNRGDNITYPTLGLTEEAGEVSGKVKRIFRDDEGTLTPHRKGELVKELGDVLWYVAAICFEIGVDMDDVAAVNLEKLAERKIKNTLHGAGDSR